MKQFASFWLVFCLWFHIGNAQQTTERHIVTRGETLMDVAKYYNVTVEDIQDLNPDAANEIKENDVLVIPKIAENETSKKQSIKYTVKTGDTKYSLAHKFGVSIKDLENQNPHIVPMLQVGQVLQVYGDVEEIVIVQSGSSYVVKGGDTKYSLSKKFGISVNQMEEINPQIVPTLLVGQTLKFPDRTSISPSIIEDPKIESQDKVPDVEVDQPMRDVANTSEDNMEEKSNTSLQNTISTPTTYVSYTVRPGETLFGLSKTAGMSMEAFRALNPILSKSVQTGMVIKMPSGNTSGINSEHDSHIGIVNTSSNYTDLTQTVIASKTKNLMFFLPFSENEFSEDDMNNDHLSEYLKDNRDFFRGAILAMDSAKSIGLNFDFNIVNTSSAKLSSDFVEMAKEANINSFDAVILPLYQKNVQDLAALVTKDNIPVVTTSNFSMNKGTSNLYEAVPTVNAQRKAMLEYLSSKNDNNLIVISDKNRSESKVFISANAPEARFVEVRENGTFSSEDLAGMFQKNSKNYVVLDTDKNGVFISATNILLHEMSNYPIQLAVLESSLIPDDNNVSRKRFVILKMLYPSSTIVETSAGAKAFKELYREQYYSEPETMSKYGFDITFDTLLRLFQPENFEKTSTTIRGYNTLKFKYTKNESGYYSNFGVNIFQYQTNETHKQVN